MRLYAFLLGQQPKPAMPASATYETVVRDAELAEELDYEGVWVAEHHFSNYCLIPNPLTFLAALSQRVRRVRIGTGVIVLPLHSPIRVAEEVAMIDHLSEGRLDVGLGRGYQPYEFRGLGIPFADSAARLAEGLALLRQLWTSPDQAFRSEHFAVPALTTTPVPCQQPHPPVWLACGSQSSIGAALDNGAHVVAGVGMAGRGQLLNLRRLFEEECQRRALDPRGLRFGIQTHAILARTPDEADLALRSAAYLNRLGTRLRQDRQYIERGAIDGTGAEPDEPTWESLSDVALVGPATHMAEQLAYYEGLGVTDVFVNVRFGDLDDRVVRDSMAALAQANRRPTRVAAE